MATAFPIRLGADRLDAHAGKGCALFVDDLAVDSAFLRDLGECQPGDRDAGEKKKINLFFSFRRSLLSISCRSLLTEPRGSSATHLCTV